MGDSIASTVIKVIVQENGIIRLADSGFLIGRLVDEVDYETMLAAKLRDSARKIDRPDEEVER